MPQKKSLQTRPICPHLKNLNNVLNLDINVSVAGDTEVVVVAAVEVDTAVVRLRRITGVDIHDRDLALTLHAVSTITGQIATRLHTCNYHIWK